MALSTKRRLTINSVMGTKPQSKTSPHLSNRTTTITGGTQAVGAIRRIHSHEAKVFCTECLCSTTTSPQVEVAPANHDPQLRPTAANPGGAPSGNPQRRSTAKIPDNGLRTHLHNLIIAVDVVVVQSIAGPTRSSKACAGHERSQEP